MSLTTIQPRFPSIRIERNDSGATAIFQHPDDPEDPTFMPSFLNEIREEEANPQLSDTQLELTLKTPEQIERFIQVVFIRFLTDNCPRKALRATSLGNQLCRWESEPRPFDELHGFLAPVTRKLLALATGGGLTLVPGSPGRETVFTCRAVSSLDFDGAEISEMALATHEAIPVLEITLDKAEQWLVEDRPAVSTTEFLKRIKAARRWDRFRDDLALAGVGVVALAVMLGLGLLGIRFLEWLEESGYSRVVVVLPAIVAVWLAWSALRKTPELIRLFPEFIRMLRQASFRLRVLLLSFLVACVAALLYALFF